MKRKPTAQEEASDATLQQQVSTTTCRATGDTASLCFLSFKCLCSRWIFFLTLILPSLAVQCLWSTFLLSRVILFEAQKCWENQTPQYSFFKFYRFTKLFENNFFYPFFIWKCVPCMCTGGAGTNDLLPKSF
jgi:hypothetical protein